MDGDRRRPVVGARDVRFDAPMPFGELWDDFVL